VRAFFAFFLAPPLGGAGLTRDVFFLGPRFRGDDNIGAGFRFAYLAENVLTEAILTVIVNFSFWLTDGVKLREQKKTRHGRVETNMHDWDKTIAAHGGWPIK